MSTNGTPRWRRIVGAVLLVVGCVLVPVSLSAVWVRNTLLDTDNYVSTVGPLADDPQVQQAIANRVTDALFANVDVEEKVADALPPRAGFLATPVADGIRTAVEAATLRLAESDRFETLWENANRRAHEAVVNVLTGGGSRVTTEDGTVAIDTAQIVENVKAKLDARGITVFDDVRTAATSSSCSSSPTTWREVQGLVDLLQTIAWVLPFVALACFAGAIALSGNRRRTVQRGAIGVAFAVAVQIVLLKAGRNLYLDAVTTKKSTPGAAGSVWDQLTSFLRTAGFAVIAVALVIAFVAWVVGPSSSATSLRGWWDRTLGTSSASDAGAPGPVASFVARSKPLLRGLGAAIAFVVLIAWNHPTALTVLGVGVLFVVYLVVLELLGTQRDARTGHGHDNDVALNRRRRRGGRGRPATGAAGSRGCSGYGRRRSSRVLGGDSRIGFIRTA